MIDQAENTILDQVPCSSKQSNRYMRANTLLYSMTGSSGRSSRINCIIGENIQTTHTPNRWGISFVSV